MSQRINWPTSLFLIGSLVVAVVGTPLYVWQVGLTWFDVVLFLVMFHITGMSITVGYHRLFAHRAFSASWPVRLLVALFGAAAFENSVLLWASEHRYHHKYTDHDGHPGDPYSIKKGFLHAHMGWLLKKREPPLARSNVEDLERDPFLVWQDRYIHVLAVAVGFGLPVLLGALYAGWAGTPVWMGALGGFLISGCLRIATVHHCTFLINSLAHTWGRQPYDSTQSPRDNGVLALFTFGEGYHNYHHTFQNDYRNGIRFYHWDPSKWIIWTLGQLGLASHLRRTPRETIRLAILKEKKRRLEAQIANGRVELSTQISQVLESLEERLEQTHLRCRMLLAERGRWAGRRLEASREAYRELRRELKAVRREFRRLFRAYLATHKAALALAS